MNRRRTVCDGCYPSCRRVVWIMQKCRSLCIVTATMTATVTDEPMRLENVASGLAPPCFSLHLES